MLSLLPYKPYAIRRAFFFRIFFAIAIGLLLRLVVGLHPIWWLVWLVPAPLLVLAFCSSQTQTRWLTALAAVIGLSANFSYYQSVMPLVASLVVIAAQTWVWVFVVGATRRVVVDRQRWWTVFAYPVFWVALDTLMAAFLPDGNWASLAYSQSEFLAALQITSVFGVAGLLFLVTLVPSALALAVTYRRDVKNSALACAVTALLVMASMGYGVLRLQNPTTGNEVTFGLVAIDNFIGPDATAFYMEQVWQQYDQYVTALADQGAHIIILPEKIAVLSPPQADLLKQHLSSLALKNHVWLEVGVGLDDGGRRLNLLWLFSSDGALSANYQKHYMAPLEREYLPGHDYEVRSIDGIRYGLAICKNMHFAALGRAYGERHVAVMLVSAWDFKVDAWMGARMTVVRGVENGYSVVRSSREGLLGISDAYGRILVEQESAAIPGRTLFAKLRIAPPMSTIYTRIGDLFGWAGVVVAGFFLLIGRRFMSAAALING